MIYVSRCQCGGIRNTDIKRDATKKCGFCKKGKPEIIEIIGHRWSKSGDRILKSTPQPTSPMVKPPDKEFVDPMVKLKVDIEQQSKGKV